MGTMEPKDGRELYGYGAVLQLLLLVEAGASDNEEREITHESSSKVDCTCRDRIGRHVLGIHLIQWPSYHVHGSLGWLSWLSAGLHLPLYRIRRACETHCSAAFAEIDALVLRPCSSVWSAAMVPEGTWAQTI